MSDFNYYELAFNTTIADLYQQWKHEMSDDERKKTYQQRTKEVKCLRNTRKSLK